VTAYHVIIWPFVSCVYTAVQCQQTTPVSQPGDDKYRTSLQAGECLHWNCGGWWRPTDLAKKNTAK